ncbi:hypothetical protein EH165_03565 [Nakamurella antarctica]|uniref:Uncharacterized protein n=1 Tax=Nakamurella antarctica TaxID=1902245 RepID=A0A3G8ZS82_9ACTN|nr:hypothetical protein [Nakamurella antarctica]AZI57374.1 hypothetical protein EH165_03565 [Nakamurella antarctica]
MTNPKSGKGLSSSEVSRVEVERGGMQITRIVRVAALVAAVAVLGACSTGSDGISSSTISSPTSALSTSAPDTTVSSSISAPDPTASSPSTASSAPVSADAGTMSQQASVPAASPTVAAPRSSSPSSRTNFGVTYVSVTGDWTGDQLFTKPRSDGSPVAPGLYGSGVSAQFQSPSGNIACQIQVDTPEGSSDGVVCDIRDHAYVNPTPPTDVTCASNYGQTVQILPTGVRVECSVSDGAYRPGGEGLPLPAGSQLDFGGVTCLSTEYGIRCLDNARQVGFMIGRNILAEIAP